MSLVAHLHVNHFPEALQVGGSDEWLGGVSGVASLHEARELLELLRHQKPRLTHRCKDCLLYAKRISKSNFIYFTNWLSRP